MTGLWVFETQMPYQKYQGPPIVVRYYYHVKVVLVVSEPAMNKSCIVHRKLALPISPWNEDLPFCSSFAFLCSPIERSRKSLSLCSSQDFTCSSYSLWNHANNLWIKLRQPCTWDIFLLIQAGSLKNKGLCHLDRALNSGDTGVECRNWCWMSSIC